VWVGLDTATPCGLLLHELLTNCFKHAFPEGRTGRVRVELRATAEQTLMLRVGDTGCGFPDDLDFRAMESLGLQLVCTMPEQLQGTIALERAEGTILRFSCRWRPRRPCRDSCRRRAGRSLV
jgi:two-component sensor histidine kinase